jgi:hypothetical protein
LGGASATWLKQEELILEVFRIIIGQRHLAETRGINFGSFQDHNIITA